ncbi:hypothetical protein PSEUBRA_001436 [Kalmanozyma brasiliensis GHG001]|uniref:AB hydrolase-1 domain-containing protein n=1 Tax=Kalmanozyma brasiliensis (strain GHG001) TaxID=1365824 RepID=V5F1D3_KALBG|nr:uncharacterized protein PSEUBRA_001436 [Kalmanozyma brasiliensis GHG001]EST09094.1 hypothetical protein PSEUBRA_001436 [Kalmanozyma brasiliensis GHG001]
MHVPIDNIEPVSGFLTGHNPRRTKSILYGAALAALVWAVTPISYAIFIRRMLKTGSFISIPRGFWAKFWYWYSLFEIPFSIYLWILTRRAAKQPPPLSVEMQTLHTLLTKSLTAGLAPAPQGPAAGTRSRSNGQDGHISDKKVEQLLGIKAFESRPVDQDDAKQRRERFRSWFLFAEPEDIYEDNVREWLAWAFAARNLQDALADEKYASLLNDGLEMVKLRLGWPDMKKGYNPKVKAIRLTLDPVRTLHRPFGYYVVTNGVSFGTIAWLLLTKGFKWETDGKCTFLVKPAAKRGRDEKPSQPIVFLHGLGIGLGQYTSMLSYLAKHKDGVVILIQPHISTNIFSKYFLEPPSKDEQAQATISTLRRHNFNNVTTLSHSNGTMVLGWLLRTAPTMFNRNILVDPVSFCMWEGSVCYSFIHRRWASGIEALLGYFVGRELGVAHTIARRFLWFDMILWADEFPSLDPEKLQFIFAERDVLVDVPGSVKYLTDAGVSKECITVMRGYNHGQALIVDNNGMKLAMKQVRLRV